MEEMKVTPKQTELALAKLKVLGKYPYSLDHANDARQRRRFKKYHPVHTPLRTIEPLRFERYLQTECKMKWKRTDFVLELDDPQMVTSQRYVYPGKVKWYILHPDELFVQHTHWGEFQWPTVFFREGLKKVGNGNHRVVAAMLLGIDALPATRLEAIDVIPSAKYLNWLCRTGISSRVIDTPAIY